MTSLDQILIIVAAVSVVAAAILVFIFRRKFAEKRSQTDFQMDSFTFRLRFNISPLSNLAAGLEEREILLTDGPEKVVLYSGEDDQPIYKAKSLVLKGFTYPSMEAATAAGSHYQDVLMLTLARLRIGSDFGRRKGKGAFVNSFLENIEAKTGERILNNEHGLSVYESIPVPKFISWNVTGKLGCTKDRFEKLFKFVERNPPTLTERERISLELFNASFFVESVDTRLIALVMAIECLIELDDRDSSAHEHVRNLIKITKQNANLTPLDKESYLSNLQWLFKESIAQAGRRLVTSRLGDRMYRDLTPAKFFTKVYALRSNLVHGNIPYPEWDDVGNWAANLEVFVADLIAWSTLEID